MRRIIKRILLSVVGIYLLLSIVVGILVAEYSVKLPRHPITDTYRRIVIQRVNLIHARLTDVSITTRDGLTLRAWYIEPEQPNGSSAILLHGVTDNRLGVSGYGELLLQHGYSVLLPDARAHGDSDGNLASYGFREGPDVHQWVDWIYQNHPAKCVYGFGESMGAGIILQSLTREQRFCAVAAESPFADFREGAFDRVGHTVGILNVPGAQAFLRPAIEVGALYALVRYGLDLDAVSPRKAVAASTTPVLLIHGTADMNIRPKNSELIHNASLDHSVLWEVPHAAHCGAWSTEHQEFEDRLLGFFKEHSSVDRAGARIKT